MSCFDSPQQVRGTLRCLGCKGGCRTRPGLAGLCASEQSLDVLNAINSWERQCRSMWRLLVNTDTKTGTLLICVTEAWCEASGNQSISL
eukprot:2403131-Rhodomonas_salina.1